MSGGTGEPQNNGLETFQFNRHTVFDSTSSFTCTVTTEVFATTVDRISETEPNIPVLHYTKSDFLAGNRMVDKQPSLDKWNVDSASNCENSHPNGCFHKGLGCPLLGAVSRGAMDFSGVQSTYQFIGTEGSTSCPSHLFKDQGYVCSTFANGQYDSPIISCQNGGYPQQRVDIHSEGNMGLSTQETDQNNCRISSRGLEYTSGHSVSTFPRLERMVAFSTSFSTNLSSVGSSGHGFVCLKTFPSHPSLYGLETRSIQSSHGCTATKMVTSLPLCFPPFSLVGRVVAKVRAEKVCMVLITPAWQTQPWYGQLLQMSVQTPILLPLVSNLLVDPQGAIHPLVKNGSLKLVAWKISGRIWQMREYQKGLQDLSQMPEDRVRELRIVLGKVVWLV